MGKPEDEIKQLQQDYQHVFGGDEGKRVLEDLKLRGFYYSTTFAGNAETTLFNEGQRAMVATIVSMIDTPFDELQELMAEQKKEEGAGIFE